MFDHIEKRLDEVPMEAKKLLADILTEAILNSDIPEESKIEVRIIRSYEAFDELLTRVSRTFGCPLPTTEEGRELAKRIYPARQAFLEYLQLMKTGLENFLLNVSVPEIPPEYLRRAEHPSFERS